MEPVIKLLVVDDDEVDRLVILRSLRTAKVNAEVHTAITGAEALAAVEAQTFDFIFIDFMLPDMNGLELLQQIRAKGITTPVQIVTSQGDERLAVEAIKTGASDYLPKSLLTPEGISKSIKTAIRLHKIEQEREQTLLQLTHTQEQLNTVITGAPIILWAIDTEGIITMSRGKGLSLIGKKEGETRGLSIYERYKEHPTFIDSIQLALKGKEATCTNSLGSTWFDSLFLPIFNEKKEVSGIIGVSYDITERVEIEQELKEAKNTAISMARIKEQFLANMSHEIRTPMNGILGLTEVLAKTNLDDRQRDFLNAISTSANNLMVIINDLLDFSKIEAGKITLEIIPFDLRQLVKQLLDILQLKAHERSNSLKLLLDDAIPAQVMGDPFRLSQILNNLVGNALKFTQKGTVKLSVEMLRQQEDLVELEFTVKDSGIGIPSEKLKNIFEKFNQGSNDTSRRYGGTGLGLSIAKELVEVQGGQIALESTLGLGSTFKFTIPYRNVNAPSKSAEYGNNSSSTPDLTSLNSARILLAEDNPINQLLVKKIVEEHHLDLHIANNGQEAIDLLAQETFDLVLMDMQMPEMDGYEAMHHIRLQKNTYKNIPIIALTAHASPAEEEKCRNAGANAFVSKPFKADTLLQQISLLLPAKIKTSKPTKLPSPEAMGGSVDLSFLRQFANGNADFMVEILELFLEQVPQQLQELTRAVSFSNWVETRSITHKMKPSLALVGIQKMEELNAEIEQSALNRKNTQNLPSLVQQMVTLAQASKPEIEKEILALRQKD